MTFTAPNHKEPLASTLLATPTALVPGDISVVVPVRNNQAGVDRLLQGFMSIEERPREILVVDNASAVPVRVDRGFADELGVAVASAQRPGPAHARNVGWRLASAPWVLFVDSDCIPTSSLFTGLCAASNGAVGYAGGVRALANDRLSRYYEAQRTLVPPPGKDRRPAYLVTANALVWREALELVGGFDERFPCAGGEDIDLAYRLRGVGLLSYAPESAVLHDFGDGVGGFIRRFVRYGRGNRLLEAVHGTSHAPRPFWPVQRSPSHLVAALAQFALMYYGYETASLGAVVSPSSRRV